MGTRIVSRSSRGKLWSENIQSVQEYNVKFPNHAISGATKPSLSLCVAPQIRDGEHHFAVISPVVVKMQSNNLQVLV